MNMYRSSVAGQIDSFCEIHKIPADIAPQCAGVQGVV